MAESLEGWGRPPGLLHMEADSSPILQTPRRWLHHQHLEPAHVPIKVCALTLPAVTS